MLHQECFTEWKVAQGILQNKYKKPVDLTTYKSLCFLNTWSYNMQILEREMRVKAKLVLKKCSTIQPLKTVREAIQKIKCRWVSLITLDVRNAFNSATCDLIIQNIEGREITTYLIKLIVDRIIQLDRRKKLKSRLKFHRSWYSPLCRTSCTMNSS